MDGREAMALAGSASYYLNRGINDSAHGSGSGVETGMPTGLPTPAGYKPFSNPKISFESHMRDSPAGPTFQIQNPSHNFSSGICVTPPSIGSTSDPGKKKRGRPRKYGPGGAIMSLGLSPMSSLSSPGSMTPSPNRRRGRPPGSGWKQKLAPLGEWMNSSAGLACTPHIIHVGVGEDITAAILSFAQLRPRALCILSANGAVSAVTLRQPSGATVTYQGLLEILCLSGSYLVAESGAPRNRTGGLSISVCSPDGQLIGGAIGGKLITARPVQVVVCSFLYGVQKNKIESSPKVDKGSAAQPVEKLTALNIGPSQNFTADSSNDALPRSSRPDQRNLHTDIDLTRG